MNGTKSLTLQNLAEQTDLDLPASTISDMALRMVIFERARLAAGQMTALQF